MLEQINDNQNNEQINYRIVTEPELRGESKI